MTALYQAGRVRPVGGCGRSAGRGGPPPARRGRGRRSRSAVLYTCARRRSAPARAGIRAAGQTNDSLRLTTREWTARLFEEEPHAMANKDELIQEAIAAIVNFDAA